MSATETSSARGTVRAERGAKRVRAYLGGELVADTMRPLLVWEAPYYPTYYFPAEDVREELFEPEGTREHSPSRGDGELLTLRAGGREAPGAAVRYEDSPLELLRGTIKLRWDAIDAWFEEDEEVFTHARDPYTRVDILASSRHVRVELAGVTVAESLSPRLLFETGVPVRYYLPKTHVRMDLLRRDELVTHCPYKGSAESYSVLTEGSVHENVAWSYATPLPESMKIAGLVAFYNEKVDLFVGGVLQERPHTKFG
ncbi:MAG TPA: DUF427 domain-containing protein [Solirubrobacteraceae bacterium]|nr:DUF427 domain-containing protein [Solirubrobacteraceae bacterium]